MKKFFATLLIVLVLAGTAFFFGWVQTGVPPDAYGVVRSKTHGIDPRPVKPGEFRWLWYKLIPANTKTAVFRLNTVYHEFSAKNTLPSAGVYSAFHGVDGNFTWEINAVLSFNLRPEVLVPLVSLHNISEQEHLASHEMEIAGQIEAFIIKRVFLSGEFEGKPEDLLITGENSELEKEILANFPSVSNFALRVKSINIPDFELYRQYKTLYENFIEGQNEYITENLPDRVKDRIESLHRFEQLEQYGALLTKFPILLDYLALESQPDRAGNQR